MVVVPKNGGKWRVCVDYTNLNESCPKDSFPLPCRDQIVDATVKHGILSFMDAFSRYHQIPMHLPDAEKTAFIAPHGLYYYNVMSFGLKNARATYQRMVTKIFRLLIGNPWRFISMICSSNLKNSLISQGIYKKPSSCCEDTA